MSRSVRPVEWGKFGRLHPVARFLHLPEKAVRQLRRLGYVRLWHGRTTPECLREDWQAHARRLEGGELSKVAPLSLVEPARAARRMACEPISYSQVSPQVATLKLS